MPKFFAFSHAAQSISSGVNQQRGQSAADGKRSGAFDVAKVAHDVSDRGGAVIGDIQHVVFNE